MESYQTWFGEGPELSVLRMLGLFDRPADEKALGALLKSPAIPTLTESLTDLRPTEWRTILARLRRARLLTGEDPHNPGRLDTHPLVREYFGEQLRNRLTEAWKECNRRLFAHYRAIAPALPDNPKDMEPLFLSVKYGCNAGLFRDALHEVYLARIQRGNVSFAAKVLGARAALLSVLAHFFEHERWGSFAKTDVGGQSLTTGDRLFILLQAGLYLVATRGFPSPHARACYECAESMCHSHNRPLFLFAALEGQWRYSLMTDNLSATMQVAERVYSLAQEQNDSALLIGAYRALSVTLFFLGDFKTAYEYSMRGVLLSHPRCVDSAVEEISAPAIICLCYKAITEWHLGEIASSRENLTEAISQAKTKNDMHALAVVLWVAAVLAYFESNPTEVEHWASDWIELSTHQGFALWLAAAQVFHGWAQSAAGSTAEGLLRIENGIQNFRATGSRWLVQYLLALKAEALHLADRTSEALEAIREAETLVQTSEERWCYSELHRLKGVFLAAMGAEEAQIETSFGEAIRIAKEQKSVSLEKRAEATYAEYRRQKASGSRGRGFRLPVW